MAKIKEIFQSIQGEGLHVGQKQIFVRFVGCNLNCAFCDTDFISGAVEYTKEELFNKIKIFNAATISLTGGEPLLSVEFIKEFLIEYKDKLNKKIHLETNGTLYKNLAEIIDLIDVVAMDIKIQSAGSEKNRFFENEEFLKIAKDKAFVKVVFNADIKDDEINSIISIVKKYSAPLILQPKTPIDIKTPFLKIYDKFYSKYQNVRLIPQTHTFLNIE